MRLPLCIVNLLWIAQLKAKCSKLFIIKVIKDGIYWQASVSIFIVLNVGLCVPLCCIPIIMLIVLFYKRTTFLASDELPQKIVWYFTIDWKYAWYIILSVSVLLQYFTFLIAKHVLPSLCNINLICVFQFITVPICSPRNLIFV